MAKANPLRELNETFEEDLKLGGLLRRYRDLGNELLSISAEITKAGFKIPDLEQKHLVLSIFEMTDEDED